MTPRKQQNPAATSAISYRETIANLSDLQAAVLILIFEQPYKTRRELSTANTRFYHSSLCARLNELVSKGLVQESTQRRCTVSGRLAYEVSVSPQATNALGLREET
jgi:hypothetical protein